MHAAAFIYRYCKIFERSVSLRIRYPLQLFPGIPHIARVDSPCKVILSTCNFNASERLGEGKSSLGIVARTRKVVP